MRKTLWFSAIYWLLVLVHSPLHARITVSDIQFENLSVEHGLSQSTIIDIIEDSKGYIWIATMSGLNRYDGYDVVQYNNDPNDIRSLPDQFVRQLFNDNDGNLWIGTARGLAKYHRDTDDFEVFNTDNSSLTSNEIWSINQNKSGRILIADKSNLFTYNSQTNKFTQLELDGEELPPEVKITYVETERTWIGSYGHGIFMLEHASNKLYNLKHQNPWGIKVSADLLFDIEHIDDKYWLATENGLFVIDTYNSSVKHLTTSSQPKIVGNVVRSITADSEGNIWVGTTDGINIIDKGLTTTLSLNQSTNELAPVQNKYIFKIYRDSNNTMWVGTYTGGALKYNKRLSLIKHYSSNQDNPNSLSDNMVWAFGELSNGQIWIATQSGGVNLFNPETAEFKHFLGESPPIIWDLAVDKHDKLWLATSDGLYAYELSEQNNLREIAHLNSGLAIQNINIFDTQIWLGNSGKELSVISIEDYQLESITIDDEDIHSVRPLIKDSNGLIWLASNTGLILYNPTTAKINKLPLKEEGTSLKVIDAKESERFYWLTTTDSRLLKLSKDDYAVLSDSIIEFKKPVGSIITILLDDSYIYAATSRSVTQINMNSEKTELVLSADNLKYNELSEGAGLLTESGYVVLGGTKGFHIFNPSEYIDPQQRYTRPPALSHFSIKNISVNVKQSGSPLSLPISETNELVLNNEDFPFTFTFSQTNPVDPNTTEYRYKMVGLSDSWFEADKRVRQATFSNLQFGNYEFQLQSKPQNGLWSQTRTLKIKIKPPVWLQQHALAIYGLLLLLVTLYFTKQYKAKRLAQRKIRDSEERLKLTLWGSGDELWDWDIENEKLLRVNPWNGIDFPQDELRESIARETTNIHKSDLTRVQGAMNSHLGGLSDYFEATYRLRTQSGEWIWVLDRGKVIECSETNHPTRMTGTLKNISHMKLAEEQLKLFKSSIETISDGVFITDKLMRIISVNPAYCQITGETANEALASNLKFNNYPESFKDEVKSTLRNKGKWSSEIESVRTNGESYVVDLLIDAIYSEDGEISHYVGVFADVTTRKSTERELLKLTNSDTLTDLPNRSYFQANHQNLVRKDVKHALLCLDMDNFKKINDSLGHETGDRLIKAIAHRLRKIMSTDDTCYRLGGDEFSFLLEKNTDVHHVTHLAQKILDEMKRSFTLSGQEFVLGGSIGIAFYPNDGKTPQELLKNADTAMYHAKNAGGNQYQFFSGEMNQKAVRQLQIENLIRVGIKDDLFTLFYQPKVDVATGQLVSMEALVRFDHDKGFISPGQFIPLAEETGLIVDLSEQILFKACNQTRKWVETGLFNGRVAVNLSARQFELPDLDLRIAKILKSTGLDSKYLECEITESALMQHPEQALSLMQKLRNLGIHLALDDFGTGYSSLAYLKRFPLNTLKIDKAFIDDIVTSETDKQMVASIITIAHNLKLQVVAEGVEDEAQLRVLRELKCEVLQGYLYSKPLTVKRFSQLLEENLQLCRLMQPDNSVEEEPKR